MTHQSASKFFLLLSMASALTLAACGSSGGDAGGQKTAAPMPPITEMDSAMAQPAPKPLPLSESDTLTPVMPVAAAPASSAPAGTIGDSSIEGRIARLEQAVGALRSDYDRIMPAFASLNTTNERIQILLDQMEADGRIPAGTAARSAPRTFAPAMAQAPAAQQAAPVVSAPSAAAKTPPSEEDMAADETATPQKAASVAPAAAPETPIAEAAPAPSDALTNTVTSVRIGEHGSKTRLVFDLTSKTKPDFKYDLDNGEKLLLVEMPSSAWGGKASGTPNSPLIAGWNAQKGASGGSAVAIQLKKDARILSTEFLKAEGKDPARLVMDIASGG